MPANPVHLGFDNDAVYKPTYLVTTILLIYLLIYCHLLTYLPTHCYLAVWQTDRQTRVVHIFWWHYTLSYQQSATATMNNVCRQKIPLKHFQQYRRVLSQSLSRPISISLGVKPILWPNRSRPQRGQRSPAVARPSHTLIQYVVVVRAVCIALLDLIRLLFLVCARRSLSRSAANWSESVLRLYVFTAQYSMVESLWWLSNSWRTCSGNCNLYASQLITSCDFGTCLFVV